MSAYRVFVDDEGNFGEEGCGFGRTPKIVMTFEVNNGQVGELANIDVREPVKADVKAAKAALQSWL